MDRHRMFTHFEHGHVRESVPVGGVDFSILGKGMQVLAFPFAGVEIICAHPGKMTVIPLDGGCEGFEARKFSDELFQQGFIHSRYDEDTPPRLQVGIEFGYDLFSTLGPDFIFDHPEAHVREFLGRKTFEHVEQVAHPRVFELAKIPAQQFVGQVAGEMGKVKSPRLARVPVLEQVVVHPFPGGACSEGAFEIGGNGGGGGVRRVVKEGHHEGGEQFFALPDT